MEGRPIKIYKKKMLEVFFATWSRFRSLSGKYANLYTSLSHIPNIIAVALIARELGRFQNRTPRRF